MSSKKKHEPRLSRREKQILDALYELGQASAADIHAAITNPPSYTAVRTHLTNLEEKGQVRFHKDGTKYIYEPIVPKDQVAKSAMDNVVKTFFENNVELVVAALLDPDESNLTPEQLDRLAKMIDEARQKGQ
ncbi:MAG: BlaI/MecI/CopY family transcriptional regulator [Armatimonadetes bacterium]|nr:BlaI/MecI/CopY family transcriptional regulator [Armatimonadota bacterium]